MKKELMILVLLLLPSVLASKSDKEYRCVKWTWSSDRKHVWCLEWRKK